MIRVIGIILWMLGAWLPALQASEFFSELEQELTHIHLENNGNGYALGFTLRTFASAPNMTAQVSAEETGVHYSYNAIPESEYLYFPPSGKDGQEPYYTLIAKASVMFDRDAALSNSYLPKGVLPETGDFWLSTLEKGLRNLVTFSPEAFEALEDGTTALITTQGPETQITLYSSTLFKPLVKLAIPSNGKAYIKALDESWYAAPNRLIYDHVMDQAWLARKKNTGYYCFTGYL